MKKASLAVDPIIWFAIIAVTVGVSVFFIASKLDGQSLGLGIIPGFKTDSKFLRG